MRCNICGAKNVLKHTPQQNLLHALKVLNKDAKLIMKGIRTHDDWLLSDQYLALEMATQQADDAIKGYKK
jgi:hypothetical protein